MPDFLQENSSFIPLSSRYTSLAPRKGTLPSHHPTGPLQGPRSSLPPQTPFSPAPPPARVLKDGLPAPTPLIHWGWACNPSSASKHLRIFPFRSKGSHASSEVKAYKTKTLGAARDFVLLWRDPQPALGVSAHRVKLQPALPEPHPEGSLGLVLLELEDPR